MTEVGNEGTQEKEKKPKIHTFSMKIKGKFRLAKNLWPICMAKL